MLFFRKTYVLCIYLNRLSEAILTNTQTILFIKNYSKVSVIHALDGSISCLFYLSFNFDFYVSKIMHL